MSLPIQLRIYTLRSASAAQRFAPRWTHISRSLQQFHNAKALGVYIAQEKVIALVRFGKGADPVEVMKEYVATEQFKKDMGDVEKADFVGFQGEVMQEVEI